MQKLTFVQSIFVHQVINTRIVMANIAVEPIWRKMTHGAVTMVIYAMEAKLTSKVVAVQMMIITNVQPMNVEIINQVKLRKKQINNFCLTNSENNIVLPNLYTLKMI